MQDFESLFSTIKSELSKLNISGKLPSYIPELQEVDPNQFGVHLTTITNNNFSCGNSEVRFSIQSIAKVLSLTLAYKLKGESIWKRVGIEPSGSAFNSLVQLEYESGIPRNPFINAGAHVICDILINELNNPKEDLLNFIRDITGNENFNYDEKTVISEKACSYRNTALINLMKDFKNIENDVDEVLDLYFNLCSIKMTCNELSKTFLFLASAGINPISKKEIINYRKAKRINAVMHLCGFYDEAGEFAFKVGLPGKSGVGGGIVAVYPGKFSIAVWSPELNEKGNSAKGTKFLELLTTYTSSSIY